jgi:hypothetical protein
MEQVSRRTVLIGGASALVGLRVGLGASPSRAASEVPVASGELNLELWLLDTAGPHVEREAKREVRSEVSG